MPSGNGSKAAMQQFENELHSRLTSFLRKTFVRWIGPYKQENKLKGPELLWNLERLDFLLNKLLVVSNPPCSQ